MRNREYKYRKRLNINGIRYIESRLICEKVYGKKLRTDAIVHHIDGDSKNNKNNNLLICHDKAYHNLIHQRTRAYIESGNANYLKCKYCKQYEDPKKLFIWKTTYYHNECHRVFMATYMKERRLR